MKISLSEVFNNQILSVSNTNVDKIFNDMQKVSIALDRLDKQVNMSQIVLRTKVSGSSYTVIYKVKKPSRNLVVKKIIP